MNQEQAVALWNALYGETESAYDYASHPMRLSDFGNENSPYGWTVDYKRPLAQGGSYQSDNLIPCSFATYRIREGKNSFSIGTHKFEVRKGKRYKTYDLFDVTDKNYPMSLNPEDFPQEDSFNQKRKREISMIQNPSFRPDFVSARTILDKTLDESLKKEQATGIEPSKEKTKPAVEEKPMEDSKPIEEKKSEETIEEPQEVVLNDESSVQNKLNILVDGLQEEEEIESVERALQEESKEKEAEEPETVQEEETVTPKDTETVVEGNVEEEKEESSSGVVTETPQEVILEENEPKEDDKTQQELEESKKKLLLSKEEIQRKEEENKKLQEEISSLNSSMESSLKEKEELTAEIARLNAEKEELEQSLSLKEKELEENKNSASQNQESLHQEIDGLKTSIQNLQNSLSEKENLSDGLGNKVNTLSQEKEEKEELLAKLQKEMKQFREEEKMESTDSDILSDVKDIFSAIQSNQKEKEEHILSLTKETEELKQKQEESQKRIDSLSQEKTEYEARIQSLQEEKARQEKEFASLSDDIESNKSAITQLEEESKTKQASIDSLNLKIQELEETNSTQNQKLIASQGELASKEEKINQLQEVNNSKEKELEEMKTQLQQTSDQKEHLQAEKNTIQEELDELKNKENILNTEKEHLDATILTLNAKITELSSSLEEEKKNYQKLSEENDNNLLNSNERIKDLSSQIKEEKKKQIILENGGKKEYLNDILEFFKENELEFTEENVQTLLKNNPFWLSSQSDLLGKPIEPSSSEVTAIEPTGYTLVKEETTDVTDIENERGKENKALKLFVQEYGQGAHLASDFAGRLMQKSDYNNHESNYGWNFILLDSQKGEEEGNVVIANLKTLHAFSYKDSFSTNGHTFQLVKEDDKYRIRSVDQVTDPFDYHEAIEVTKLNETKTSPILYIFVKVLSASGLEASKSSTMKFFDLIDRTVKRCCPESFIEMKTKVASTTDYAFITFDGSLDVSYKEILRYAMLLNTYRGEFYKQHILNAIIVVNQIEVPFSMRHLTLDRLIEETQNTELTALRYELLMTTLVSSLIAKTIHIGPSILKKLNIPETKLRPSRLGVGNFAKAYGLKEEFKTYNYGYALKNKVTEVNN